MHVNVLLNRYLDEVRGRPFRPGVHDCALFVAGWVKLVVGKDLTQGLAGQYRSLEAGKDLLRDRSISNPVQIAEKAFDEVPVSLAQIGDVVVMQDQAFGILAGERAFVLRPDGLGHIARSEVNRAFRVR